MEKAREYSEEWVKPTPCLCRDGMSGTLLILEYDVVCSQCGNPARQRMSFVWKGTLRNDLKEQGYGVSVKHYFTTCGHCGSQGVS